MADNHFEYRAYYHMPRGWRNLHDRESALELHRADHRIEFRIMLDGEPENVGWVPWGPKKAEIDAD